MSKQISERDNFTFLTTALIILLFSTAVADQFASTAAQFIVQGVTVVTLAIAVWNVKSKGSWYRTRLGFIAAIFIVAILGLMLNQAGLHYAYLIIMLVFFSLTAWQAGRQVLFSGPVDLNKILGAVCIYLLMGLIWAVIYLLFAQAIPEAFNGQTAIPWYENFADFIYFSFVTLTTLGFGDISPAVPVARFLVYMEAIVGQFYLAVLVASLIGIRVSDQQQTKN